MEIVPRGYYGSGYNYPPLDARPSAVASPIIYGRGSSGYVWSSATPPPPAPPLVLPAPRQPVINLQPVPRDVYYGDYAVVPTRGNQPVKTSDLSEDDLRRINDDLKKTDSDYTSVVIGGDQSNNDDIIIIPSSRKSSKWRIIRQEKLAPPKTDTKPYVSDVTPVTTVYPPVPQTSGYIVPIQTVPLAYPPSAAVGGYYRPAAADVVYDSYPGYYL